jgi:asparagine synthase (glutamine-hydrolysing)
MSELPAFLASMDQPTNDGVNTYFCSKAARQAGLKVVLSGLGGDEVFWGYRHYSWLEGQAPWLKMFLSLPNALRGPVLSAAALYGRTAGHEKWRRFEYLRDRPTVGGVYSMARGFFNATQVSHLAGFSPSELKTLAEEVLAAGPHLQPAARVDGAAFNYLEVKRYLHDQLLRDADVFSMAHSVETRIPFLDHELVCQVACLPAAMKHPNGTNKPALLGAVPHPIVAAAGARTKMGFTFPIGRWLLDNLEPMREMALQSGQLNHRETGRLFQSFEAGRLHWSQAWAMIVLGSTLRQELT